jgi:hypothetical protein
MSTVLSYGSLPLPIAPTKSWVRRRWSRNYYEVSITESSNLAAVGLAHWDRRTEALREVDCRAVEASPCHSEQEGTSCETAKNFGCSFSVERRVDLDLRSRKLSSSVVCAGKDAASHLYFVAFWLEVFAHIRESKQDLNRVIVSQSDESNSVLR